MYDELKSLDAITLNFNQSGVSIINLVLAFVMFGVALGIRPRQFKTVFSRPKSVIAGLLLQWAGLPAVTFLLILLLKDCLTPMVALGMILVASCPGGNVSNFMSSFSRGNVELSVSMTAVTTCTAPFVTPFNFALWGGLYLQTLQPEMTRDLPVLSIGFLPMFLQVILLLGIPVALGLLCARFLPGLAGRIRQPMQAGSLLFFIAMVAMALGQNFQLFLQHIPLIFVLVFIHNLAALGLGYGGASLLRLPPQDRRSLTIEVGIQNSGLGLALLFNPAVFPQSGTGGMLFITAWWGIWHIVSGLTVSLLFRRVPLKPEPDAERR